MNIVNRMIFATILAFFSSTSFSQACYQPQAKTNDVAEYLSRLAESLVDIKSQYEKMENVAAKNTSDPVDALVVLKELKEAFKCSASTIKSYKDSKIESISKSSDTISSTYIMLGKDVDTSISQIKLALDGKSTDSPGIQADRSADNMLAVKNRWKLIGLAIAEASYAAIDMSDPKAKKADKLILSKVERDKILAVLKTNFNLNPKGDIKPIDMAAVMLANFLAQPWRFR